MGKQWFAALACGWAGMAWSGPGLTEMEARWLQWGAPVLAYARGQGLPLDVIVQPQATPGNAPLAMAYVEGRCKLVLSMRGNPQALSALEGVPEELSAPTVEAMTAHELGHCWRYARGAWHTLPAGFAAARDNAAAEGSPREAWHAMQQARHEEGFADLVGLAWIAERHPERYARIHAWLLRFRDEPEHPGSHHDTLAWVRLAPQAQAFGTQGSLFERAWPLWQQGLPQAKP